MRLHYLHKLFAPDSIAVFGVNERDDSVAGRVFRNLRDGGFAGRLHPINPSHARAFGETCHARIAEVRTPVDLAIIATPAKTVPDILRDCGAHGVETAIVLSGGFGESGATGQQLERELSAAAQAAGIRVLGPNCLGLMRPGHQLNATFSLNSAMPGRTALVSQSGALCTAILDWAETRRIGFSAVASLGDAADIDFGDVVDYLAMDAATHSILLYVEGIHRPRRFISALRAAARIKPVVVIKAGRHEAGSRAAMSHTGALVGNDDAFDAALNRAGAVRVDTIGQLFSAAQVLAEYPRENGRRLAVTTNAGGPGVLAADRAADLDVELPAPDDALLERLDALLPAAWSHSNPLDILGDAPPERYETALSACLESPSFDGVLAILTPQAMSEPERAADRVIEARRHTRRPVLACWMGGERVEAARRRFYEASVPHFPSPEAAVEAFACLARHKRNRQMLFQVPPSRAMDSGPDTDAAIEVIGHALDEGREILAEGESKRILRAFGIPAPPSTDAGSAGEAIVAARSLGFPVAMKINSPDITHKSDVAGVELNVASAAAVRRVWQTLTDRVRERRPDARITGVTVEPMYRAPHGRELMIGVIRDPVFGPVVSFGAGGITVEILADRAVALPPLNEFIAQRMIADTRVAAMLDAWRYMPAIDHPALVRTLLSVSDLVCELPHVRELDINPLMAGPDGVAALDARMVVAQPDKQARPYGHMAIHPFPSDKVEHFRTDKGIDVTIRPIRPEDADIEQEFVRNLSGEARYLRFMGSLKELTREMLVRFTQIDYDRAMALIAVTTRGGREVQLGVARYSITPDQEGCEFAIVIADEVRGTGLGKRLMKALISAACDRGLKWMEGETLSINAPMRTLALRMGFEVRTSPDDPEVLVMERRL